VYDKYGRLVAIVQAVVDKSKSPNAENLNFAVRADSLLNAGGWQLDEKGRRALQVLSAGNKSASPGDLELDDAR
jgi:hypothetical protein